MKTKILGRIGFGAILLFNFSGYASAEKNLYGDFPVTLKSYSGSKNSSVSYKGQIARHLLHESLKKLAGKGQGKANPKLEKEMLSYYSKKDGGRKILSPKNSVFFPIKQSSIDTLSKNKNLSGKTYKGTIIGFPNNMSGPEVIKFWIKKASAAKKGYDFSNGYQYQQLISKFIMGAVFYNQAVDNYLDEKLSSRVKPNHKPYKKGAPYTGKEHSWDEAFGYWGAPSHTLSLSAKQAYEIAKQGKKSKPKTNALKFADWNSDGKVDLYREMVHSPAYYASSYDKKGKTKYLHTITKAFLDGRKLLAAANGGKLTSKERNQLRSYAETIEYNWEKTLAESVFKYAGSVFKDAKKLNALIAKNIKPGKALKNYIKHWGELKGFSLAIQTGRKNLGATAARLNKLIGYGPVMPNSSQVIDIDSKGNFVKGESSNLKEYMAHMLKVQKLMIDKFGVKARLKDNTKNMEKMLKQLSSGASAEND